MQKGAGNKGQRCPPMEPDRQDCVGEPEGQNLGIRTAPEHEARSLGSRERRTATLVRGGRVESYLLHTVDRRAQPVIDVQVEEAGDMQNRVGIEGYRAPVEGAPGDQDAAGRTWIIITTAEVEGVAQHRLVLPATDDPHARSGSLEREALAPHAGKGRLGAHPSIEQGKGSAGQERGI
jgi:hypothetical protein